MVNQDDVFGQSEGDRWFGRNRSHLGGPKKIEGDPALSLLAGLPEFNPKRVLEVGAANGWRLAEIRRRTGWDCVGVEPSSAAIEEGRRAFSGVELRKGMAANLPVKDGEFGLVIVNFVLHWVARQTLLRSMAEVDRALAEGGYLILGDFLPDVPTRRKYHHLPDDEVFTYKQDYAKLFVSTGMYSEVTRLTFDHDSGQVGETIDSQRRAACCVLKKSSSGFYVAG